MSTQEEQITLQEITITPEAASEIQKIRIANQIPDSHALRVGVKAEGCCGVSYVLGFDDDIQEMDRILQSEGISICVDEESLKILGGSALVYVDGPQGKGFKFENPNMYTSCNCSDEKSCDCEDGCCES
jgi:iron-sulfur cluster assembly protein